MIISVRQYNCLSDDCRLSTHYNSQIIDKIQRTVHVHVLHEQITFQSKIINYALSYLNVQISL